MTWTEQEALEHLATLSVLARWIEQCTVERATQTQISCSLR